MSTITTLVELAAQATHKHQSPYGYVPTRWICILYVVLFSLTTMAHLGQAVFVKPRRYWLIPTMVFCGLCEIIGWAGRLWSSKNPPSVNAFLIQITTTIIAPTFLTAAFYTILGAIITILGPQFSRLKPKTYIITFLSLDVLALVVQAVGGAKASLAFQNDKDATPGSHIMLAGIFLQMAGIVLYLILATEFLLRFHLRRPLRSTASSHTSSYSNEADVMRHEKLPIAEQEGLVPTRVGLMIIALMLATVFILIRSIYRTIELLGGWRGHVITTEKYFNILDGAPVFIAMALMNVFHPAMLLRDRR